MQYQLDAGLTLNKLANALGAEVTLFTRSPGKEADARRLGASHVVLSTDSEQMKATANQFDLIIDTVPYVHGNDSNLLIVFYVQIMPDDFVMQLHRF